ncbi:MAG: hypothetical protein U0228_02785 [Myxococcaceae bacterium]
MRVVPRVVLIMVLVGAVAACKRPPAADTAEGTYRLFLAQLDRGQARQAWQLLSPATRDKVSARSKELVAASNGLVRDEPELLLFQGSRPGPVTEIKARTAESNTTVLEVTTASGSQDVRLVKDESGRWLIDLSDKL